MSGTELIMGMGEVINYLKSLEEENKKLKKRIEEDHKAVPSFLIKDLYIDATEENKKLKQENNQLNDIVAERASHNEALEEERIRLQSQNNQVKEENKKLQEELLYYRFYTYTLDKSGDCDLQKEDVDYFTDNEAQRKTLYERIGYEEEEEWEQEE